MPRQPKKLIYSFCLYAFSSRFPFNWKTPLGYLVAWIIFILAEVCTLILFSLFLCFYVGFCWLIISFVKDIINELDVLTQATDGQQSDRKISETFNEIVDLYSNVRQLSGKNCEKPSTTHAFCSVLFFHIFRMVVKFNQVYRLLPPGFVLWCVSTICIELLLVQLELVELIFRFVAAQIFVSNCFSFPSFNPFVPRTQTIGERREFRGYCQRICFGFALVGNSFDHIGVW